MVAITVYVCVFACLCVCACLTWTEISKLTVIVFLFELFPSSFRNRSAFSRFPEYFWTEFSPGK